MCSEFRRLAEEIGARLAVDMAKDMARDEEEKMTIDTAKEVALKILPPYIVQKMIEEIHEVHANSLLATGKYSTQDIAYVCNLTLEQVESLQQSL